MEQNNESNKQSAGIDPKESAPLQDEALDGVTGGVSIDALTGKGAMHKTTLLPPEG